MTKTDKCLLVASAALILAATAQADVVLNSVRVTGKDTEALARFYSAAFDLHEVNRLKVGDGAEIFLNFGASMDAAKSNPAAQIVLMPSNDPADKVAHVIFNVTDAAATVAAVKAAGGSVVREPFSFGNTGIVISIVADPAGNQMELIQRP